MYQRQDQALRQQHVDRIPLVKQKNEYAQALLPNLILLIMSMLHI